MTTFNGIALETVFAPAVIRDTALLLFQKLLGHWLSAVHVLLEFRVFFVLYVCCHLRTDSALSAVDAISSVLLLVWLNRFPANVRAQQLVLHLLFTELVDWILLLNLQLVQCIKIKLIEVIDDQRRDWLTLSVEHYSCVVRCQLAFARVHDVAGLRAHVALLIQRFLRLAVWWGNIETQHALVVNQNLGWEAFENPFMLQSLERRDSFFWVPSKALLDEVKEALRLCSNNFFKRSRSRETDLSLAVFNAEQRLIWIVRKEVRSALTNVKDLLAWKSKDLHDQS